MKLSDFEYQLPKELIAQTALPKRSEARLLVLNRAKQSIEHKTFRDILSELKADDLLVLNDTKVIPARLFAERASGGKVEVLLLRRMDAGGQTWKALIKPSRRVRHGEEILLDRKFILRVVDPPDHKTGIRHVEFNVKESVEEILSQVGHIPLPPYIDREDLPVDRQLYQTVFAKKPGAVASPTAGLHFDEPLLGEIRKKGIQICFVTLHVSYGSFQPVVEEDLTKHQMHEEYYEISDETANAVNQAKSEKRRVIACGTTVVRTLETVVGAHPCVRSSTASLCVRPDLDNGQTHGSAPTYEIEAISGSTNLFIYPPYQFKIADGMITNFHLPGTTLLMLTSAFAGHDFLMRAYREAITQKYRFYSYGDAMMIL